MLLGLFRSFSLRFALFAQLFLLFFRLCSVLGPSFYSVIDYLFEGRLGCKYSGGLSDSTAHAVRGVIFKNETCAHVVCISRKKKRL